jgi:Ca-activated chloride channel family protein
MEAKSRMSMAKREQEREAREVAVAQQNGSLKKDSGFARMSAAPAPLPAAVATYGYSQASNQPPEPVAAAAAGDEKVVLDSFMVSADKGAGHDIGHVSVAGARLQSEPMLLGIGSGVVRPRLVPEVEANTEAYAFRKDNDYLRVKDQPLSTFSVDVDTASYANVRRFLTNGQRPPTDAVRIEELVNYFPYNYQPPAGNVPFATSLEAASAPWAPTHRLVRIGLKGREVSAAGRPAANLVFLLDVSGSMNEPNKLPLVKQSLRLLVQKLRPDDHVAIAVYAGASGLALPSTSAARQGEILDAIDRLQAEGSTNGAMGIQLAYDIAKANFVPGGVNRVILATDGDFNVGVTSEGELVRLVEEKAKSGVFLTVLGFGMGNIKDGALEQLADKGNGNYAYIDNLAEAKKTLVEQAGGTLVTIAKDVKIQVEFNPAVVQAYRLIGYENRLLAKEDFNNDKVDAGEVGAGHTVTALYEVVPVGGEMPADMPTVDALKYQRPEAPSSKLQTSNLGEMLTVKIRYKEPTGDRSNLLEFPLRDTGMAFANASQDFKFAAAVAAFGMVLRDSPHKGVATLGQVERWARDGLGNDAGGYRSEFLGLVGRAQHLVQ